MASFCESSSFVSGGTKNRRSRPSASKAMADTAELTITSTLATSSSKPHDFAKAETLLITDGSKTPRGTSRMMMGFRPILVLAPLKPRTTSSSWSTANPLLNASLAKSLFCMSLMWSTPLFHCFSCNTSQRMVLLPTSWFPQMRIGRGSSKSNNWCISSCHSA